MNLIKALNQTREDLKIRLDECEKMRKNAGYYDSKDVELEEFVLIIESPLQYLSRLSGRNYWEERTYQESQTH